MPQKSKSSKKVVITAVRLAKPVLADYWHKFGPHRGVFFQFRDTLQYFQDYSDFFLLFPVSLRATFEHSCPVAKNLG